MERKQIFVLSLEVSEHTLNISLIKDNEYYGGVEGPDEKNNKLTCSDELGFVRWIRICSVEKAISSESVNFIIYTVKRGVYIHVFGLFWQLTVH